jgi:hypothetical protein
MAGQLPSAPCVRYNYYYSNFLFLVYGIHKKYTLCTNIIGIVDGRCVERALRAGLFV